MHFVLIYSIFVVLQMYLLTAATPKCEEKHDWLHLGTHPGDFPKVPPASVGFYLVMAQLSVKYLSETLKYRKGYFKYELTFCYNAIFHM